MCYGCYEQYGKPVEINPLVQAAAAAINAVYDYDTVGGNLHVVLDDWNIEDDSLQYAADYLAKGGHPEDTRPGQLAAEGYCLSLLQSLTPPQRATAMAISCGYLNMDGTVPEPKAPQLAARWTITTVAESEVGVRATDGAEGFVYLRPDGASESDT